MEASAPAGVKNVLLVHGVWADRECWNQVITNLNVDGYNVAAAQLPLTSLADDATVVHRALSQETGRTLLVRYS